MNSTQSDPPDAAREPILVPCVGSGTVSPHYLCPMCGTPVPEMGEPLPAHDRMDILAMLHRGDFG